LVAELACWLLLAASFFVTTRWHTYYEAVIDLNEPPPLVLRE
jgi:hypothetical protein